MVLRRCDVPLSAAYDTVLFDLDGVVYLGERAVPAAAEVVAELRADGVRLAFVTNNASRSPADVAAKLAAVGVPADPGEVVTSAQAAAALLASTLAAGSPVLVMGAPALVAEVEAVGLRVVHSADDGPVAVVNGYWSGLTYADAGEAALAIRAGAWWVATNLDATIPTERGLLPGNGALSALLATATGRQPVAAGKPARPLLDQAVARVGGGRALFIGDRLDTDIAGANAAGLDALLVFTGVADPAALLGAEGSARPAYIAADLSGVRRPHPAIDVGDATAGCAGWVVTAEDDRLTVRGSGESIDALRAAAAMAWQLADRGRPHRLVTGLPALDG